MELDQRWFDLYRLLIELKLTHGYACQLKSLQFDIDIDENLPRYFYGDSQKLNQVLLNLINNAIKFTESGFVKTIIRGKIKQSDLCQLTISVCDTGIGVAEEKQAVLFEPFTQADSSTTRKYGGSGLGLAITHRMVALLGGDISVTSQSGQGTTFTVHIPLLLPTPERSMTDIDIPLIGISAQLNNEGLKPCLEKLGYQVALLPDEKILTRRLRSTDIAYQLILFAAEEVKDVGFLHHLDEFKKSRPQIALWRKSGHRDQLDLSVLDMSVLTEKKDSLEMVEAIEALVKKDLNELGSMDYQHLDPILLVEDNAVNKAMTEKILLQAGFKVVTAVNGEEALERCQKQAFSLILMDCHMPVMDGLEATRQIRKLQKKTVCSDYRLIRRCLCRQSESLSGRRYE